MRLRRDSTVHCEREADIMIHPSWRTRCDHAVFYQIYPQTFYDSNGDGAGDLPGIIAKLDYVKSLGVGAIWLSPFHASPFRDAGYDASDFYTVAARYGTNDDARLFAAAHERSLLAPSIQRDAR
jgi:maltose alpha-D-glucosyltransferase/alpha-amylase